MNEKLVVCELLKVSNFKIIHIMRQNYFEDLLKEPTIFKDETKLDINYVPKRLPHREKELSLLSQLFLSLLTNPNKTSRKVLITGKIGIGKTVTAKIFGNMLLNAANKRKIQIKYIHINCRKERTSYKVLIKILRSLDRNFPKRGYSPQDLLEITSDFLESKDLHLLLILDELSYLINNKEDLIYSLTRINDDLLNSPQRVSIIGIVRDISCLSNLDHSTLSTLQKNIIKFKKYSKDQIFNILKYRAEKSLKAEAIKDDLINIITDLVSNQADIRLGLNLLWRAGKIAEGKGLKSINMECIRLANQEIVPFLSQDIIQYMGVQKLIFLTAIVNNLKRNNNTQTSLIEILKTYQSLCENLGFKQRSYSQMWNYLQELKKEKILTINLKSKNIKGRKALIEINDISLPQLEKIISNSLKSKGVIL